MKNAGFYNLPILHSPPWDSTAKLSVQEVPIYFVINHDLRVDHYLLKKSDSGIKLGSCDGGSGDVSRPF